MIHEVLGVIDAREAFAFDAEVFRALSPVREHQRIEAQPQELLDGEGAVGTDGHVAQVGDARVAQDFVELAPQATFHLVLVEEDAVLGEASGLDVAIEQEDPTTSIGEGAGGEESRRTCPDDGDYVALIVCHGSAR